jgi:hypothetical protein
VPWSTASNSWRPLCEFPIYSPSLSVPCLAGWFGYC